MKTTHRIELVGLASTMSLIMIGLAAAAKHTVERSNSPRKISKDQLGSGTRWNKVCQINRPSTMDT